MACDLHIAPQGKEVATQLKVLPAGSVRFDDIGTDTLQGAVKKPVIRSFTHGRGKEVGDVCVVRRGTSVWGGAY